MKEFTVKAEGSFKFTSSRAFDPSKVFTAFKDYYETGYICIDSKGNSFILDVKSVEDNLQQGIYKIVSEGSETIIKEELMNDKEFLKELIERAENSSDCYFEYAEIVSKLLPKYLHEQLSQLVKNPTHDGDILSKCYRNELLWYGLAIRVCANGEQGYTAAKYFAFTVLKSIKFRT